MTCDDSHAESSVYDHMDITFIVGGHILVLMTTEKAMNFHPGQRRD